MTSALEDIDCPPFDGSVIESLFDGPGARFDADNDGRPPAAPSAAQSFTASLAATGGGFKLVPASELYKPQPSAPFLVEGVIREASVILLGAFGGSGKTWLAVDLLVKVGCGGKWLGRFKCAQGPATFIDYESGAGELGRRIRAVSKSLAMSTTPAIDACIMPDVYMTDAAFPRRIQDLAASRQLIVIDSLAAASPGAKENDAAMRIGLDHLRRAAEATKCTFVVLVHAKKTSGSVQDFDPREILRGSSAIYDAADAAFVVVYRHGRPLRLMQVKARHGIEIEPIDVNIRDHDSGVVVSASSTADRQSRKGVYAEMRERLLEAAPKVCPCSKTALAAEARGEKRLKFEAIDDLLRDGLLIDVAGQVRFANRPRTTHSEKENGS